MLKVKYQRSLDKDHRSKIKYHISTSKIFNIYRVFINDLGNVLAYYLGQKAACELEIVSSSPIS